MQEGAVAGTAAEEYEDLFELLSVKQQQAVARGDIKLEALLERLTSTEASDEDLCPKCAARPIGRNRLGYCDVCARHLASQAFGDEIAALAARREADALKQQVCRDRRRYGLNPRRPKSEDGGAHLASFDGRSDAVQSREHRTAAVQSRDAASSTTFDVEHARPSVAQNRG